MAAATLVLDAPQLVTLEATGTNLRQVIIPAGARWLEYSSEAEWYWQPTGTDGAAGTASAQMRLDAGTSSMRCPGSGSGRARLVGAVSIYLAGSGASQVVHLRATSDGV